MTQYGGGRSERGRRGGRGGRNEQGGRNERGGQGGRNERGGRGGQTFTECLRRIQHNLLYTLRSACLL